MPDTGLLTPDSAANLDVGTDAWVAVANALTDDGLSAAWTVTGPVETGDSLYVSDYAAVIPTGATVVGCEIEVDAGITGTPASFVSLAKDSSTLGGGVALTAGVQTYGNSTDIWGFGSISEAEAEHANFGVVISASSSGAGSHSITVDYAFVRIYYSVPAAEKIRVVASGMRW